MMRAPPLWPLRGAPIMRGADRRESCSVRPRIDHEDEMDQHKLLDDVQARAATDERFRHQLLVMPHEAIRDAFGVSVPATYRMRFIERDPQFDLVVVLPDVERSVDELSDADLDAAAGGTSNTAW